MSKCVLITGASRGIGAAIAERLARDGFNLAINYVFNTQAAEEVLALCLELGVKAKIYKADVSDFSQCEAMINSVYKDFGGIYGLVNNAGITRDGLLMKMSEQQFDQVIDTNLKGAFSTMRYVAPIMLKAKAGRIINISSVSGLRGNAGQANYSAAKAGLCGLTMAAAKELGSRGITVNAVAPGFIETDMTAALPPEIKDGAIKAISLRRLGKTEEVAAAVSFLISPQASYITGQILAVDGGLAL